MQSPSESIPASDEPSAPTRLKQQQSFKPRRRTYLACAFCRSRKQKCDSKQPQCSNCELQKAECVYRAASKRATVTQHYVQSLLKQIETLQSQLDETVASPSTSNPGHHLPTKPSGTSLVSHDEHSLNHVTMAVDPSEDQSKVSMSSLDHFRNTSMTSPSQYTHTRHAATTQASTNHQGPGRAHSVIQKGVDIDLHTLPQRWLANHLVDCYMELCHPQYPFIHEATFRKDYGQLWTSSEPPSAVNNGTINAVFALACHFSPGISTAVADSYFRRAKGLILSEHEPEGDRAVISTLQALALLAMYPQGPEAQEEIWDMIGMMIRLLPQIEAPSVGEPRSNEEKIMSEMKVRLWWACFVLDAVHSSYWGRESRFAQEGYHIRFPQALEDEGGESEINPVPNLPNLPPKIFFFVQTIRLCQLMRDVALTYWSRPSAAQTLEIDQQILDWYSGIPFLPLAEQVERVHGRVWRQCEVLTSRFLHLRVFLLTQNLKSGYAPSKPITAFTSVKDIAEATIQPILEEACVKAAVELLQHLGRLYSAKDGPHSAWWYDLKKIMASSCALLLKLNKLAEGPFVATPQFETEEKALQIGLRLLQQIEHSGKPQATHALRRLEKEFYAVREKLLNLQLGHTLPGEQPGVIPGFSSDTDLDFLGGAGTIDEGLAAWETLDPNRETMETFWIDLLH